MANGCILYAFDSLLSNLNPYSWMEPRHITRADLEIIHFAHTSMNYHVNPILCNPCRIQYICLQDVFLNKIGLIGQIMIADIAHIICDFLMRVFLIYAKK